MGEYEKMALGSGEGSGHFWVNCDKGGWIETGLILGVLEVVCCEEVVINLPLHDPCL